MGIPPSPLPHPLQVLLRDGRSLGPPSASLPPSPSRPRALSPRVDEEGPGRLVPLMTRSVVERWRLLPDMVLLASSRLLETASAHLRRRPQRSRLPGPVSPPRPGPGSSGRPGHQKEALPQPGLKHPLTGRRPTGRPFLETSSCERRRPRLREATGPAAAARDPARVCARALPHAALPTSRRPAVPPARLPDLKPRLSRNPPQLCPEACAAAPCARALPSSAASDSWVSLLLSPPSLRLPPSRLPAAARACGTEPPNPSPEVLHEKAQPKSGHLVTGPE